VPRLKGAQKLWLLLVAPMGMMFAYFGVGWVHILVHNSTMPTVLRWVATTVMMAMMVGWMVVLHRVVGRPAALAAPRWTFFRLFSYGRLSPTRGGRMALWEKMCEEGGVLPEHGLARDPEDPGQALMVGPSFVGNGTNQLRAQHEASL
jgi:hypothetical protein